MWFNAIHCSEWTFTSFSFSYIITIIVNVLFTTQSSSQHQQTFVAESNQTHKLFSIPNLPRHHYQFWLRNHPISFKIFQQVCSQAPKIVEIDNQDVFSKLHINLTFEDPRYLFDLNYGKQVLEEICSKIKSVPKSCWGYEKDCQDIYLMPDCSGVQDEQKQKIEWFKEADFGFVLDRRYELSSYCSPNKDINDKSVSSFECTKNFRVCRGENLYIHFNKSLTNGNNEKLESLIKRGNIGGWNCDLQLKRIKEENGLRSHLQSWFNELQNYQLIHSESTQVCEKFIDKQVLFIKFDASDNFYDFFSNFINLYATMHLNNKFSIDNAIIVWNELNLNENARQIWPAFSRFPPSSITKYYGKQICFKKFIFALPPRINDGLLHKSSFASGCSKSGLIDAFNKHILHRLNIPQIYTPDLHVKTNNNFIRVTIVKEKDLNYKATSIEEQLKASLEAHSKRYFISIIDSKVLDLKHLITHAYNTDIFIGIRGSGLALSLFLPDWATVVELHDCGSSKYANLARLRGIDYVTGKDFVSAEEICSTKKSNVDNDKFIKLIEKTSNAVMKKRATLFAGLRPSSTPKGKESEIVTKISDGTPPTPPESGSSNGKLSKHSEL